MEHKFEEIFLIADNSEGDISKDGDGETVVNHENIQRSRLRVDVRKWAAAKLSPKKYGDRLVAEHSGPNGAPMQHRIEIVFVSPETTET